jgi:hypothetical protein
METKKWYLSRTIQIAIIQAILGLITVFVSEGVIKDVGFVAIAKSILDLFLRMATTTTVV